jgi:TctA family transporter
MINNLNRQPAKLSNSTDQKIGFLVGLQEIKSRIFSIIRGSTIGSVLGLMPGGGATVSSSLAFSTEQAMNKSMISRLVSAEAANNAAAVTSILPVLIYGLPVLASEALIVDLISAQGILINKNWTSELFQSVFTNLDVILLTLIVGNIVVWWISIYMVNRIVSLYQKLSLSFIFTFTIIILWLSILFDTVKYQTYTVDIVTVVALLIPAFVIIRMKIDTIPLVFSFMLTSVVISFMATAITFLT